MRTRFLLLLTAVALVALGGAWLVLDGREAGEQTYVSEHDAAIPEAARRVTVSRTMPMPSASERRLSAMLEQGRMIGAPTPAEVLTDTDCAPDAGMVSRCRNEVRLPDGSTIVLRHPHDMSRVPCLAPGEHVVLVPASA
jgi:hypothetical protein